MRGVLASHFLAPWLVVVAAADWNASDCSAKLVPILYGDGTGGGASDAPPLEEAASKIPVRLRTHLPQGIS